MHIYMYVIACRHLKHSYNVTSSTHTKSSEYVSLNTLIPPSGEIGPDTLSSSGGSSMPEEPRFTKPGTIPANIFLVT